MDDRRLGFRSSDGGRRYADDGEGEGGEVKNFVIFCSEVRKKRPAGALFGRVFS